MVQFAYCKGLIDSLTAVVDVIAVWLRDVVEDSFSENALKPALGFEAELGALISDCDESAIDWVLWISMIVLNRRTMSRRVIFKPSQMRVGNYDR